LILTYRDLALPGKDYYTTDAASADNEQGSLDEQNLLQPQMTLQDILLPPVPFDARKIFPSYIRKENV